MSEGNNPNFLMQMLPKHILYRFSVGMHTMFITRGFSILSIVELQCCSYRSCHTWLTDGRCSNFVLHDIYTVYVCTMGEWKALRTMISLLFPLLPVGFFMVMANVAAQGLQAPVQWWFPTAYYRTLKIWRIVAGGYTYCKNHWVVTLVADRAEETKVMYILLIA